VPLPLVGGATTVVARSLAAVICSGSPVLRF